MTPKPTPIWTPERVESLLKMCAEGKPNGEIAAILNLPIAKIYAKRSQLGITIDKCGGTYKRSPISAPAPASRPDKDFSRRAVEKLYSSLIYINPAIESIAYENGVVTIALINGCEKRIEINALSVADLLRRIISVAEVL